ncbi:LysR family transcriptional regulator [Pigmentiphaga aceris]|uniref:LysR family transcriptional regulator n=1 Tax=Pigmentiphaga aceris TaxID=1940612 RepID=A0A5C0B0P5_9BURK|nr:LysR family transcriptional regulator [Pigmentiphaga aceris]QEI08309.1 LysR family transcriptional regulator [Pigmentiphaga aceris]
MIELDNARIDELAALLAVAREGSFVAAGRALERHASIVSKRIAALEQRLGVRLIERTTRRVRLTETGSRLADKLRAAGTLILDAEQEASQGAAELRGKLRIAFPTAMGRQWLAPLLPTFMKRYPALQVEVNYSERYIDLVAEGYDAAVRIGVLRDSRLVARKLGDHQRILCASPDYLEQYGVPTTPADLAQHNCLEFQGFASYPEWHLSNGERTESVTARGSLRSNDNMALLEAARAGVGILGAGEWLMSTDLRTGTLVRVLPDWAFDVDGGIYLVRPSAQFTPARTTAFIDWIREQFRSNIPWGRAAPGGD